MSGLIGDDEGSGSTGGKGGDIAGSPPGGKDIGGGAFAAHGFSAGPGDDGTGGGGNGEGIISSGSPGCGEGRGSASGGSDGGGNGGGALGPGIPGNGAGIWAPAVVAVAKTTPAITITVFRPGSMISHLPNEPFGC